MRMLTWIALIGAAIAMSGLIVACSSDDESSTPATSAAATQDGAAQEVTVTMTEFDIESSMTEFRVGVPYHFVVTNKGQAPHELMIMQPVAEGAMTMSEMDRMAVAVIEEDDLGPGVTEEVDVTFDKAYPAGSLEFSCHTPGHYELGMHLAMTVQ